MIALSMNWRLAAAALRQFHPAREAHKPVSGTADVRPGGDDVIHEVEEFDTAAAFLVSGGQDAVVRQLQIAMHPLRRVDALPSLRRVFRFRAAVARVVGTRGPSFGTAHMPLRGRAGCATGRATGRAAGCTTGTASKWHMRCAKRRPASPDDTGNRRSEPKYTAQTGKRIHAPERVHCYLKLPNDRVLTTAHKKRRRRVEFLDFMNDIVAAWPDISGSGYWLMCFACWMELAQGRRRQAPVH